MIYCINPECRGYQNLDKAEKCQNCGTLLLINNDDRPYSTISKRSYRIIQCIDTNQDTCTEVFEVEELDPNDGKKFKILKAIHDNDSKINRDEKIFPLLTKLFEREARFLCFHSHWGIPKGYDFFPLSLSNGKKIHCFVMEKIEGINLQEWVRDNGAITEIRALEWLKQIVNILKFVHENHFFHRDIKPSNIMWRQSDHNLVLIDFGAVRDVSRTANAENRRETTTYIGSYGYVAPEQLGRNAQPQSDFYSLGRTFVYLLTGKNPHVMELDEEIFMWDKQTHYPISESLIKLINYLMEEDISKRPENTQTILERLNSVEKKIAKSSQFIPNTAITKSAAIASGVVAIALTILLPLLNGQKNSASDKNTSAMTRISETCNNFKQGDNISCGEESLISPKVDIKDSPQEKVRGMGEIKEGKYSDGVKLLGRAWEKTVKEGKPDPETLIYLNNAKILNLIDRGIISPEQVHTIAVAAPLRYEKGPSIAAQALEMLRGIAQAQNKAIDGKEKTYLLVAIANDANRKDKASEIAEELGKNKGILGVIGHYSSSIVEAALPKYQNHQLPLVSPASTSVNLSGEKYLYRIAPSDAVAGKSIANYLNERPNQKVAILWSRDESFSESLKTKVEEGLTSDTININNIIEKDEVFNLGSDNFDVQNALNEARKQGVTAIILIPDGGQTEALSNAYNVIQDNIDPNLIMIGADTLYTNKTITYVKENVARDKFLVAVGWHPSKNKNFSKSAKMLWSTKNVSWLTATAYDATLVLIEAIKQKPSREGVNQVISATGFKVSQTATGEIRFDGSDRDNPEFVLLEVLPNCTPGLNHLFFPEEYQAECAKS